ncbi:MAG: MotA/TolQ/ExbB proton channel family protein [Sulfurimonas sp.]|nr:MotA/TolQ/ExbB proton channel family protein [Sulfurimonas sp.]MDQ7066731.1 MotA/TolQ/ExbB proton channel family protein [Sulfurimonas sp.]
MKKILLLIAFIALSLQASQLDSLLLDVNKNTEAQLKMNKLREEVFLKDLQKSKKLLRDIKLSLKKAKNRTKQLKETFKAQKVTIQNQNKELEKNTGTLKNLFAISKQEARDLSSLLKVSMTSTQLKNREKFLNEFSTSHSMPTINNLRKLWKLYIQEIIESGKTETYEAQVVDTLGIQNTSTVTRVGLFSAFDKNEYIRYDDSIGQFVKMMRQPKGVSYVSQYYTTSNKVTPILVDPTKGVLFHMLKEKATVMDRINQGGIIGYIILMLGILTIIYSIYKYITLVSANSKMNKQMKSSQIDTTNPLGRILAAFEKNKNKNIETIESKMDTAILKELPDIQSGLPMIKLVAAVAPLLGLLGTVTGMIETFQSITLFGTGDPKLMAGGISQALMTTVLGLVVAIPILFIYNVVQSKSKKIIEILTQQSSVLVAKQLEMLDADSDERYKNI